MIARHDMASDYGQQGGRKRRRTGNDHRLRNVVADFFAGLLDPFQTEVAYFLEGGDVPVPEALHTLRARLGIDYGKLDYVIHEGQVQLLDVNRTPTFARHEQLSEYQRRTTERFARSLLELFEQGPTPERHG